MIDITCYKIKLSTIVTIASRVQERNKQINAPLPPIVDLNLDIGSRRVRISKVLGNRSTHHRSITKLGKRILWLPCHQIPMHMYNRRQFEYLPGIWNCHLLWWWILIKPAPRANEDWDRRIYDMKEIDKVHLAAMISNWLFGVVSVRFMPIKTRFTARIVARQIRSSSSWSCIFGFLRPDKVGSLSGRNQVCVDAISFRLSL